MIKLLSYLIQYRFRDMGQLIQNGSKAPHSCEDSLEGKRVLLSGATSGIGRVTARYFAQRGAKLLLLNRNPQKSQALEQELQQDFGAEVQTIMVDFSSFQQVRQCADQLLSMTAPLDVLVHNSGVFNTKRHYTGDGIEMVYQVNHLSAFLLNYLLKEKLKKENRARILFVSSEGHRFALTGVPVSDPRWERTRYGGLKSYGAAKTAQLLTMRKFVEYFKGSKVTVNAMHPGNVISAMGNNNGSLYRWIKEKLILSSAVDPIISAQSLHYLAASAEVQELTGKFFHLTHLEKPAPHARDKKAAEVVWQQSLELCGLK